MRRRIFLYVRPLLTPLLERTVNYPNNVLRLIESGVDGGTVALDISNASFDLFYIAMFLSLILLSIRKGKPKGNSPKLKVYILQSNSSIVVPPTFVLLVQHCAAYISTFLDIDCLVQSYGYIVVMASRYKKLLIFCAKRLVIL